ncbi:hypothetical protein R1sor_010483 [Riccia sorocarpa]|uniref:Reverse transcriptase domain-containing protein n=1 Tax=Riccia sorocarpa TaxID=122646 RepID=A0ABD3HY62_9MARC
MAESFEQFLHTGGLTVLNGTHKFKHTYRFTFRSHLGNSVVDFLLASPDMRDLITDFQIGQILPESDHCPLTFIVQGLQKRIKGKSRGATKLYLDRAKRHQYEDEVTKRLGSLPMESEVVSRLLKQVASQVFPSQKAVDKSWFDDSCRALRQLTLACTNEDRHTAYRKYKNFARAKKKRWLQERHVTLKEELFKNPQTFWRRLRSPMAPTAVDSQDLYSYLEKLYAGPVTVSPVTKEPTCIFSEAEVLRELNRMDSGKAADLEGLFIELLKWGGEQLLQILTRMLNQSADWPDEWFHRKVIPLFKAGPRSEPSSYRIILVGSVFARLLGKLLEARLNLWCEERDIRAPAQAGFRRGYSTLDHCLVLRTLCEKAKHSRKTLFILFVDFAKAFDTIPREKLWFSLSKLGVPGDLVTSLIRLYQKVLIKINPKDEGVSSSLGVIQGCPASPTLFGLVIDDLYWQAKQRDSGITLGSLRIPMLLFADDVAIVADDANKLREHIAQLEQFCVDSGIRVNLAKTKWLSIRASQEQFYFQSQLIERCGVYKYLGIDFAANLSWLQSVKSWIRGGMKALFALRGQCDRNGLLTWSLRKHLFDALVPYVLLLAESGSLPVEVEALILTLQYVARVRAQDVDRYSRVALLESRGIGWFADLVNWTARWGLTELEWEPVNTLRTRLQILAVQRLWASPSPRLSYYLRDINRMDKYIEQLYLHSALPKQTKQLLARYRTSSHALRVEEGRWIGLPRDDRTCKL